MNPEREHGAPDRDDGTSPRHSADAPPPARAADAAEPIRPPRLAEALLALLLPAGAVRESVLGDLHELFSARAADGAVGRRRANRWYWHRSLAVGARYGARRFQLRSNRAEPAHVLAGRGFTAADVLGDARLALRSLRRRPGFSLPVLGILSVGMTAATAIFTVVDSIVFKPLDLPDAHRVVTICEDHTRLRGFCVASPANTEDLGRATTTLSELGWGRGWGFRLTDAQGSEGVRGWLATASYLRALGVRPVIGRIFTDEEVGPDHDDVVLLSHAFWTTRYGRDPGIVGSTVQLDGEPYQVVGILPAGFEDPFLRGIELWKPPHVVLTDPEVRAWRGFQTIGRLAPGSSLAAAEAELSGRYDALAREHAEVDAEWSLRVQPLQRVVVGDSRVVLLAFLWGAGLLLAIVCANVANLLLAHGIARRSELAVRTALGAGRGRLVGQMAVESLVLAFVAAVIALLLSRGGAGVLKALAPSDIPRLAEVGVSVRVLAFLGIATLVLTAAFAVVPSLRSTSWDLSQSLRSAAREGEERGSSRLRAALLVAELAFSMVLLTSAGLLARSFARHLAWEPGFETDSLLAVSVFVDLGKHPTRAEFMDVIRRGEERVASIPGVVAVSTASAGPLFGGGDGATPFETDETRAGDATRSVWWFDVGPGFFATVGIPVLQGRALTEDDAPGSELVAVVNQAFARLAWSDGAAVGRVVKLPEQGAAVRVVGVVADVPSLTPGEGTPPEIYWSNRQLGRPAPYLLVRTSVDPATLAAAVRGALLEVDPGSSLGTPFTLASARSRALVRPRFQALVMAALALVALLLSAAGVYAVVSYAAARRVREMGIRRALGATSARVVGLVMRSSLVLSLIGVALGALAAVWSARFFVGLIPGVTRRDVPSLLGAAAVLVAAAVLAAAIPALRAARADPLPSMRE